MIEFDQPELEPVLSSTSRPFLASFPGKCPCGNEFDEGESVQFVDDELVLVECCGEDR